MISNKNCAPRSMAFLSSVFGTKLSLPRFSILTLTFISIQCIALPKGIQRYSRNMIFFWALRTSSFANGLAIRYTTWNKSLTSGNEPITVLLRLEKSPDKFLAIIAGRDLMFRKQKLLFVVLRNIWSIFEWTSNCVSFLTILKIEWRFRNNQTNIELELQRN